MKKSLTLLFAFAAVMALMVVVMGTDAYAKPDYFTAQGCSGCHYDDPPTCSGCHAHGTHSSVGGSNINLTAIPDKTVYSPGEAMTISFSGGTNHGGWVRAILYDENGVEITRSSGPGGTGSGETFPGPIVFSVTAPTAPGTYTYSAAWFGNQYDKSSAAFGDWRPASMPNHGEEVVQAEPFVVQSVTVTTPDITVTDSVAPSTDLQIPFGSLTVGASSSQTVTVANDGDGDLVLGTISVLLAPFAISADNCSNTTLSPGTNCSVSVSFTPSSANTYSDSFIIPSNDPDENPVTVDVSGSAAAAPVPDITVTDSVASSTDLQIPFGSLTVGSSIAQTVTVANDGNANLVLGSISGLQSPFAISADNCSGQTLAPGANCTVGVNFAPSSANTYSDSFNIPSNDPDENPVTVSVSGTATAAAVPDISVTDSVAPSTDLQVPFGSLVAGNSAVQTVAVENVGQADLTIAGVAQSNTLASPFSITGDNCSGAVLVPSGTCTVTVEFAPASEGAYSDAFDISSDDPDEGSVTVNVSGNATATPVADITVSNSTVAFGNMAMGSSAQKTVTITNDGQADLDVFDIAQGNPLADPFTIISDNCSNATLAPGVSCTVTVGFSPLSSGTFTDSFEVTSSDPDESSITVSVSGSSSEVSAGTPDIGIGGCDSSTLDLWFGSLTVGKTRDKEVTVTSCGDTDLLLGSVASGDGLSAPFSVKDDACSGATLSPGSSCKIKVTFSPTENGNFSDSFDIPSNDPDESVLYVSLLGSGLSPWDNHPPERPKLKKPNNGQGNVNHDDVLFEWEGSADPDGDEVSYKLYYSKDASFDDDAVEIEIASSGGSLFASSAGLMMAFFGMALVGPTRRRRILAFIIALLMVASLSLVACSGGGQDSSIVDSGSSMNYSFRATNLDANETYYWKVVATDSQGASADSDVYTFTTR